LKRSFSSKILVYYETVNWTGQFQETKFWVQYQLCNNCLLKEHLLLAMEHEFDHLAADRDNLRTVYSDVMLIYFNETLYKYNSFLNYFYHDKDEIYQVTVIN
jgi:hypothetical protein